MADWTGHGGALEGGPAPPRPAASASRMASAAAAPAAASRVNGLSEMVIDAVGRRSIGDLLGAWLFMIALFGLFYWVDGVAGGAGLTEGGQPVGRGLEGLSESIYFSFVTALSIGYGDVIPHGVARALAIAEGAIGLLVFGCVISKLVSRRQDQLLEQTHRIAFEDRLGRVRINLHLVLADFQTLAEQCAEPAASDERIRSRVESAATVFAGELRTVHDLLYRPQEIPDEEVFASILANVGSGLRELNDLLVCLERSPHGSGRLREEIRGMAALAGEICGDCVPRDYAPELKGWMDRIQEQSRRMM